MVEEHQANRHDVPKYGHDKPYKLRLKLKTQTSCEVIDCP